MVRIATILAFALGVHALTSPAVLPRDTTEELVDAGDADFNQQSEIGDAVFNLVERGDKKGKRPAKIDTGPFRPARGGTKAPPNSPTGPKRSGTQPPPNSPKSPKRTGTQPPPNSPVHAKPELCKPWFCRNDATCKQRAGCGRCTNRRCRK